MASKNQQQESESSASSLSPVPPPTNPEELQAILMMILHDNNDDIQRATQAMKLFLKKNSAIAPMMQQIQSSTIAEARQMAAVLLRERIKALWKNLPKNIQDDVKKALLQRLVVEPFRPVRLAIAALVSSLAKQLVPVNQWNELLNFLLECSKSDQSAHREVAMMLFRALAENIPKALKPHFRTLQQIFQRGLQDPEEKVRIEALRALGEMVQMVDNEKALTSFYEVIPPIVTLAKQHIVAQDEEILMSVFEVFEILASAPIPVLDQHIPNIIQLMLEVVINTTLDIGIREKAGTFIKDLVEAKPTKVVKAKLVEPIHKCSIALMIEAHDDTEDEPTDMSPQRLGVEMLDSLLDNVPHRHVYEPTLKAALALVQSANPLERKGGFAVLSTMTEGCGEELREILDQLMPVICHALKDSEQIVRAAAAMAIVQFGDELSPEVNKFHEIVFPQLFAIMDNSVESFLIVERACDALLVFCDHMEREDVVKYLDLSMSKLGGLLTSKHQVVQHSAVGAIKSIAAAAGDKFLPYFKQTIQTMAPLMTLTGDDQLTLRCRATECVGAIAHAVGKQHFQPYLQDSVKVVVSGMNLDFFELREASYNFFNTIALMLEADFNSLLPTVITFALATLASDDGVMVHKTGGELNGTEDYGINSDEDEDEDDLENEMRHMNVSIRSGALDEKVAALACITSMIHACQSAFLPFLEKTIQELDFLSEYPHHFLRHGTINVYSEIFKLLHNTFPNARQWTKGENVKLHENTRKVVDQILPVLIARLTEEEDRETCANACEVLAELCKTFGLGAVQPAMQQIFKGLMKLVQEKAPCQRPSDDQDEQEVRDHDEILIDSVTDLISAIAAVCGPSFEPAFKELLPHLLKFNEPQRAPFDRSMAIGCIAEVVQELGAAVQPYLPKITPIIIKALKDPVIYVRRNAAFAAGNLCATGCDYIKKNYAQVLSALEPALTTLEEAQRVADQKRAANPQAEDKFVPTEFLACRDNTVSAIAKMITTSPQSLPLDRVLPVFLKYLPLREDQQEAVHVYGCIVFLYRTCANVIGPMTPLVVDVFAQVFGNPDIDTALQREWIAFCQQLLKQLGAQAEPLLGTLSPERREVFLRYLNAPVAAVNGTGTSPSPHPSPASPH